MKFLLIEEGDVYTPEPVGSPAILVGYGKIARVGPAAAEAITAAGFECEVIDASNAYVIPGLVDPHEHIVGAGGEQGYSTRTPDIQVSELITSGITTVVGCLGTDAVSRHLETQLVKTRQLDEDGITAYMYTGAFRVPVPTLTGLVTDDIAMIDKVLGVGEVAISDSRSTHPTLHELARMVSEAGVGGDLGGKAGVSHFHTGPGKHRLKILHELLDGFEVEAKRLYATHIERTPELLQDAIKLAKRGGYCDMDAVEPGIGKHILSWINGGGPPAHLSISSDAHASGSAHRLYEEFVACVREHGLDMRTTLPFFTKNAANILHPKHKGRLEEGADADIVVLDKGSLAIRHVIAKGEVLLRNHELLKRGKMECLARAPTD